MKKVKDSYMLEKFNRYGERKKTQIVSGFIEGTAKAKKWEAKHPKNSAVLFHVLYNTHDNNDKWEYKG